MWSVLPAITYNLPIRRFKPPHIESEEADVNRPSFRYSLAFSDICKQRKISKLSFIERYPLSTPKLPYRLSLFQFCRLPWLVWSVCAIFSRVSLLQKEKRKRNENQFSIMQINLTALPQISLLFFFDVVIFLQIAIFTIHLLRIISSNRLLSRWHLIGWMI